MDDVTNAFELVEAQGGHRITKQGQIFSNAVLEVVKLTKNHLPRIALHRVHGTPELICGGDVATDDVGKKLCTAQRREFARNQPECRSFISRPRVEWFGTGYLRC